ENSIYGVDLQQIAVEISKLRVFLSLVVDSRVDDSAKNRGIKPLPNLEFKFVCADSLVSLPKRGGGMFEAHDEIKELKSLRVRYFSSIGAEKHRIEEQFRETQHRMFIHAAEMGTFGGQTLTLSEWDPFSGKAAGWFDSEWMFGFKNGFDIVIANPPYVRQEAIKDIKPRLKKDFGDFYCGTADLYTYFYKSGLDMLRQGGYLCFIAPNKFMRAGYGKNTRRLLSRDAVPRIIIDFGELPVFEAGTDPSIILVENRKPSNKKNEKFTAVVIKTTEEIMRLEAVLGDRGFKLEISALEPDGWTLGNENVLGLLNKLCKNGIPLSKYVQDKFFYGIKTGLNDAFVINEETREKLISEDPRSAELIKPWLRGRDIRKWRSEWAGWYVIFTRRGVDIESYPAIKRHLEQFREDLEPRKSSKDKRGRKPGSYKWYEIQDNIAYYEEFEKPKIIYADIAKLMRASYDTAGAFCANTLYIIPTDNLSLLGILHSRLFDWYIRQNFQSFGDPWKGGRIRFFTQYMEKVPIPLLTDEQKAPIVKRVKQILADPAGPEVEHLEAEIDRMVYELYQLTPDEIALVEQ
ncbi:MAG: class I SAM-dependent DNA methyltransferase, partial [bacterium]|nr:class I SAM-dependent DNA methyltransferase [bacterium]